MTRSGSRTSETSGANPARLLVPLVGAGLIIACAAMLLRSGPETHTVSDSPRELVRGTWLVGY